ncbi:hypothetical protein ANCCAN_08474 [Ancylostoma caninum]|uniref:Uncharacterized protein n=1 Tax=Ancylostoma caninum TaxID=29170 RepID=A0A368GMI3_ANCCA|nr:hypothetical protein ANCCAN_08474 [Ancylostoma caninum]
MKIRAFIKWALDKLVVDKDDLRKLTARQRDITTDGLTRIPTAFRSAFKNFVLHIARQQQGSEYSVKIDDVLSSVLKESRRNYPRRRTLSQTEQQTMPDDAQFMMDEPIAITDL